MKVKVKYFKLLRETTGKTEDEIESTNKTTLKELLANLSKKYGKEFTEHLYNKKGKVQDYIQILINGKDANLSRGLETELKDGDTISLFSGIGRY